MSDDWQRLGTVVDRVLGALDWTELGAIYFHEDGEAWFRQRLPAIARLGQDLARQLVRRVPRGGASLWVGAGIGELPVLLAEVALLGRGVLATNLRREECDLINATLREVAPEVALEFLAVEAQLAAGSRTFDHLGCISLFTDPETWPVLSDVTYGRIAPVQLDVERFEQERTKARELAGGLFRLLSRPGWITTSAEEAAWFLEQAEAVGAGYDASDDLVETAVVGDPVGFLRID